MEDSWTSLTVYSTVPFSVNLSFNSIEGWESRQEMKKDVRTGVRIGNSYTGFGLLDGIAE
jgi:hypothetical protein